MGSIYEDMFKYYDVGLEGRLWYVENKSNGALAFFQDEETALDFAAYQYRCLIVQEKMIPLFFV